MRKVPPYSVLLLLGLACSQPIVTIAMLSLALNLLLTGVFIYMVKKLTAPLPAYRGAGA